jgi:hypothetical protein
MQNKLTDEFFLGMIAQKKFTEINIIKENYPQFYLQSFFNIVLQGHHKEVKILLMKDPTLADKSDENGNSALHLAALQSDNKMIKLLIDNKAQTDKENKYGSKPLHLFNKASRRTLSLLTNHKIMETIAEEGEEQKEENKTADYQKPDEPDLENSNLENGVSNSNINSKSPSNITIIKQKKPLEASNSNHIK